ncbi:MAG TPA: TetR/AcrR family transcriptional regulator [Solirubrobacteraceae bacterium]|nr:TetR/AcrR family transcriptional regulator [Solirubrobacteraceae bacterium]
MPRAAREQLILDVAGAAFARHGYHAASMDEIAGQADVSKPMVYSYFGSKEHLYLAYIERTGRQLLDRLEHAAGAEDLPLERLRARITEFLAFVEEHRDGWRVLFAEAASSRPLADEVADLRSRIVAAVRRMVQEAGLEISAEAADGMAHAIVGAGESLANWWLERASVPRELVVDWYVKLVQAAVVAAAAGP